MLKMAIIAYINDKRGLRVYHIFYSVDVNCVELRDWEYNHFYGNFVYVRVCRLAVVDIVPSKEKLKIQIFYIEINTSIG